MLRLRVKGKRVDGKRPPSEYDFDQAGLFKAHLLFKKEVSVLGRLFFTKAVFGLIVAFHISKEAESRMHRVS